MSEKKATTTTRKKAAAPVAEAAHDHAHGHDHHHHDHGHDHHHGHDHDHDHGHHHHHEEAFEFVDAPAFEVDYKGDCAYEVKVSIAPSNGRKKADELYEEMKDDAVVPGFRKGRAPRALLERRFGKAVRNDVASSLISAAFKKLIKDKDLRPISTPDIDGLDEKPLNMDDTLEVTLKFEVAPRCELGKYRGIKVERPVLKIADKQVKEAIEQLRERNATFEAVKGKAKDGDQVVIDFEGTLDGKVIPGGKAENYPYILGSGRFFKEFEAAISGHKAGDEVTADVAFPEDYHGKDVAGKTVNFKITVHEVKRKALPEVDEEFAKSAGYESVDEMKEKIAADLREGAMEQSKRIAEYRALKQVIDDSKFELPKRLVESSTHEYVERELRRLAAERTPVAEVEGRMEEIRNESAEAALRDIKIFTAINEIGEAEGIQVTDEDFEKEAENLRARTGMEMQVVQRFLAQSEQRNEYESRIFRQKAVAIVMEHATVTDKEVGQDALNKAAEEAAEE